VSKFDKALVTALTIACVLMTALAVRFSFETSSDRHWCFADAFLIAGSWCGR
jgi:hypothetical protein